MQAHFGYSDGSGDYFITIDTDACDGCGECATACPADLFEVVNEDPNDPFRELPLAIVKPGKKNTIKQECAPCKPPRERPPLPCVHACPRECIRHAW